MSKQTIFGMLRIKNESRWIVRVLAAALPLCERIFILDDHSTDGTPEICEQLDHRITVIRSTFEGFDESRDREYLLSRVMGSVSDVHLRGDTKSPFWALAIDGDEILDEGADIQIPLAIENTPHHAFRLPIYYLWETDMSLWNTPGQRRVRVDGVYKTFARPSLFRLFNAGFRFQRTPWGGNFHCSSIPQELLHHSHATIHSPLWHLGYNYGEDRLRKFAWYNSMDPGNKVEDEYRHMVIGDAFPDDSVFVHAGPLEVRYL